VETVLDASREIKMKDYGPFNGRRKDDILLKIFLSIVTILITLSAAIHGWAALKIMDFEVRVSTIESSTFTNDKAMELVQKIYGELTGIRADIAKLPKEVPPPWFREIVNENRSDIKQLKDEVGRIKQRIPE